MTSTVDTGVGDRPAGLRRGRAPAAASGPFAMPPPAPAPISIRGHDFDVYRHASRGRNG